MIACAPAGRSTNENCPSISAAYRNNSTTLFTATSPALFTKCTPLRHSPGSMDSRGKERIYGLCNFGRGSFGTLDRALSVVCASGPRHEARYANSEATKLNGRFWRAVLSIAVRRSLPSMRCGDVPPGVRPWAWRTDSHRLILPNLHSARDEHWFKAIRPAGSVGWNASMPNFSARL
jgi:hypothetical protein